LLLAANIREQLGNSSRGLLNNGREESQVQVVVGNKNVSLIIRQANGRPFFVLFMRGWPTYGERFSSVGTPGWTYFFFKNQPTMGGVLNSF
jgi:hypothetical protein